MVITWQHYIPLEPDFSDIKAKLDWAIGNPTQSAKIASEGAAFMKFGGGYGIKYLGDPGADVGIDYYFWGGAFNTFFWIDRDNGHFGVFATNHSPPQYNISDDIEQIVDEAKL